MNDFPPRVARFEKVSLPQFEQDVKKRIPALSREDIEAAYGRIVLPARGTAGSSGYDIRTPFFFSLKAGEEITIPTGLRCRMAEGWCLLLMPRSGLGFKLYTRLANTVGNIDSDYYHADNEGHIAVKFRLELKEDSGDPVEHAFEAGSAICQGIFVPFGITEDDEAAGRRTGGFGSTGR